MKFKSLIATLALTAGTAIAAPAAAQVQGNIGVANEAVALAGVTALQNAYNQISQQYAGQIQAAQQQAQRRQTLLQELDTNNDQQLDEAEQAAARNMPQFQQLAQIDQQAVTLENQINRARAYAVEQVLMQYGPTLEQVVTDRQVQIILPSDGVIYAPQAANITPAITQALNTRVTSVQIAPPQEWQATRVVVGMMQRVNQVYAVASAQQEQQQEQQTSGDSRM